jgi:hypothetical protein
MSQRDAQRLLKYVTISRFNILSENARIDSMSKGVIKEGIARCLAISGQFTINLMVATAFDRRVAVSPAGGPNQGNHFQLVRSAASDP